MRENKWGEEGENEGYSKELRKGWWYFNNDVYCKDIVYYNNWSIELDVL